MASRISDNCAGQYYACYRPYIFLNWYGFVGHIVFLFFMVRSAVQVRKSDGGVLSFSSAFIAAFITMTIGVLFSFYLCDSQLDKP